MAMQSLNSVSVLPALVWDVGSNARQYGGLQLATSTVVSVGVELFFKMV